MQLMILLRFLESNYVSLPGRVAEIGTHTSELNKNIRDSGKGIVDYDIPTSGGEYVRWSKLDQELSPAQIDIGMTFAHALEEAILTGEYEDFKASLEEDQDKGTLLE